ncbi:xylogalacturonan beta-1 [Quercus suber]|uniref:Xylogalacturonan beta-1 n=1 Tax=Quercus suber TaxID=58331 RepID=A0AAW0J5P8_QUESU
MYLSIFFLRITSCGLHGPCNEKMAILVQDFFQSSISKHPYWNRTQGANHFIVNCDDICWKATIRMRLFENAIQVACESLDALEFKPIKDIVLPGQEVQPFTHRPPGNIVISNRKLMGKYSNEGFFFKNLNESQFLTTIPREAHLKFIPISTYRMQGKRISFQKMAIVVQKYFQSLISKYHHCNPNEDHFFVNCHGIGVIAANGLPLLENATQVVCASRFASKFTPSKDTILPAQKLQPFSHHPPSGKDIANRNSFVIFHTKNVQKHFKWNTPPVRFDAVQMAMYELWRCRHSSFNIT